jgi:hypothetical protein
MARQQGIKRDRTARSHDNAKQAKSNGSLDQNHSDGENEDIRDHQETHPSKKKVRWDSGVDDSSANDQDDSADEAVSDQQVRCLISITTHCFIHRTP